MVTEKSRRTINSVCECEHYKAYYEDYIKDFGCERDLAIRGYSDCIPGASYCLFMEETKLEEGDVEYYEKISNATIYEYIEALIDYINKKPEYKNEVISHPTQLSKIIRDYTFNHYIRSEHDSEND